MLRRLKEDSFFGLSCYVASIFGLFNKADYVSVQNFRGGRASSSGGGSGSERKNKYQRCSGAVVNALGNIAAYVNPGGNNAESIMYDFLVKVRRGST